MPQNRLVTGSARTRWRWGAPSRKWGRTSITGGEEGKEVRGNRGRRERPQQDFLARFYATGRPRQRFFMFRL